MALGGPVAGRAGRRADRPNLPPLDGPTDTVRRLEEDAAEECVPRTAMTESKINATHRLQRDGRWPAFSKRRAELRAKFRAEGMPRAEATEKAWEVGLVEFPPLDVKPLPCEFSCPKCGQRFVVAEQGLGQTTRCPQCAVVLSLPAGPTPPNQRTPDSSYSPPPQTPSPPPQIPTPPPPTENKRTSWLAWLVYGATPKQRLIRQGAKKVARELERSASQLASAGERAEHDISAAVSDLRSERITETLQQMPVDALKDVAKSIRLDALRGGGYHTIGQLRGVSPAQLRQLHGIGPSTAAQDVQGTNALTEHVQRQPLEIPSPAEIGPQHSALLRGAYSRIRTRQISHNFLGELRNAAAALSRAHAENKRKCGFLRRLFKRDETEQAVEAKCRDLAQMTAAPNTSQLLKNARVVLGDLEPPMHGRRSSSN